MHAGRGHFKPPADANAQPPKTLIGRTRWVRFLSFMTLLRIEPYVFINRMATAIKTTPLSMLKQDKICKQVYNRTDDFCYQLPMLKHSRHGDGDTTDYKSMILADAAEFENLYLIIKTVPALVWILFLGPWLDRYVKGRKVLMMVSVIGSIVETLIQIYMAMDFKMNYWYLFFAAIPPALTGGHLGGMLAASNYITMTTPPKQMALRFMIYELCMFTGSPTGTSLGGFLLNIRPKIFRNDEILNYSTTFIVSLGLKFVCLFWIWFMIDEKFMKKKQHIVEMKLAKMKGTEHSKEVKPAEDKRHPIKQLFDLSNVKDMVVCCIKQRPNRIRAQIFMLVICMTISMTAQTGVRFLMPFSQKVYFWTSDWYSYMRSMNMLAHGLATLTIVPFMIKVVKISDIRLTIIGYLSRFVHEILLGTFLFPCAYYVGILVSSISGISMIGIKAHYSKIIELNEVGKVFGLIAVVDHLIPMFSSTFYTKIFNATMNSYPGAVFHIMALTMILPIGMMMWIDLFTKRPEKMHQLALDDNKSVVTVETTIEDEVKKNEEKFKEKSKTTPV